MALRWTVSILLASTLSLGCNPDSDDSLGDLLPNAEFSTKHIDFGDVDWGATVSKDIVIKNSGDLPLGVGDVALGTGEMEENFNLRWSSLDLSCSGDSSSEEDSEEDGGDPNAHIGLEVGDTGFGTQSSSGRATVIQPDCTLTIHVNLSPTSVGEIHGSVIVDLVSDDGDPPEYYRDPDTFRSVVMLKGNGLKGAGNIVVSPRTMDFGHPAVGETLVDYIRIHNVGTGELALEAPDVDEGCDEAFTIDLSGLEDGAVVPAKTSTLIPVTYTPIENDDSDCDMVIRSDDVDMPTINVTIKGKEGTDPNCTPPTAIVLSPESGYVHASHDDLTLTLKVSDNNEPATELHCSVRSLITLEGDEIADCTPYSTSGYTEVTIPGESLLEGVDVLQIRVKDDCNFETYASTSILVRTNFSANDDDGDGFDELDPEHTDCDDTEPLTYPNATEIYDGKDNDCDGEIDEETEGSDDDHDGFTENEGDCNDYDYDTYPGAPEQADRKDNDCDGTIDEGTSLYDDDGDGFAEVDNDCDDTNPEVSPAATEYCDGLDNNCNGLKDSRDGCIEVDAQPRIIGGIQMDTTALGPGESTIMTVAVFDPQGQGLIYSWQQDDTLTARGHDGFDSIATQTVTWTAPHQVENDAGEVFNIHVIVTDDSNNTDFAFAEITIYPEPVRQSLSFSSEDEAKGCNKGDEDAAAAAALVGPGILMLFLAGLRRREED